MWGAEDLARESTRRQARGLSTAAVAEKALEAARRRRETRLQVTVDAGPYASDPQELADLWAAKDIEWRRIAALMEAGGWSVYDPERDSQASHGRRSGRHGARTRWTGMPPW